MARNFSTKHDGSFFDESTIEAVWKKGEVLSPTIQAFGKILVAPVCNAQIMERQSDGDGNSTTSSRLPLVARMT